MNKRLRLFICIVSMIVLCLFGLFTNVLAASPMNLLVDGTGSYGVTSFTVYPAGVSHISTIDDPVGNPDDNTTRVYYRNIYGSGAKTESYTLASPGADPGACGISVAVYFRGRTYLSGNAAYFKPCLVLSGVTSWGTQVTRTLDSYGNYQETISRPGGGSWTWSDLAGLEVGMNLDSVSSTYAYLTQLYVIITYSICGPVNVSTVDAVGKATISTCDNVSWSVVVTLDQIN